MTGAGTTSSSFHPRLDVTPSPSPPPSRTAVRINTQDPVRVPGDESVFIVLCFKLQFGPHFLESEPLVIEPDTKAKKAVVEEDPAMQWVTNAGLVCVSRPRLRQELAKALELPVTEVVVGEIAKDGTVDVAILDREVAASLFGAKHQEAMDALGTPAPPPVGLAQALERLRPKLEDPNSVVHNPPLNSIGQLRLCLPARQARGDTLDLKTGLPMDLDTAWDWEEHVLVADLASGSGDAASRLVKSEVTAKCGRVFPRHDGSFEFHNMYLCPTRPNVQYL
jgi:hypothetical protein